MPDHHSTPAHHAASGPDTASAATLPASTAADTTRRRPAAALTRYRWHIAARALAATGVNYVLCSLFAALAALALTHAGLSKVDAVLASTMLTFILFGCIAMWAFHCASNRRLWVMLACATASLTLLTWQL